jgi:type I restriction enzyme S subunit
MNAVQLLEHFDRLAEAPDAVSCLRRFILDLAVRGKLVEQDPNDEPAGEFIGIEQNGEGKAMRRAEAADLPYQLPGGWKWVRLGDRLKMVNGRAFKPTEWLQVGLPIVRIQNLNNESAPFNYCDPATIEPKHVIEFGCFLISWSGTPGTSFGAFIWRRGKAALNQHIFNCFQIGNAYFDRYLQLAINGRLDEMIAKAHGGVGLQHITKGKLENLLLSLPPLSEQRRIVAKVDELMGLCDRLEASQAEREQRRNRLAAASLHRLNEPSDDVTVFRAYARFHLDHLPRFTIRPDQIPALRQTILNLAVRGRLVPQDPKDEPALDLLKRIQTEKVRSAKNGEIRATAPLPMIRQGTLPFELPVGWTWVRLQYLLEARREISYGIIKLGDEPKTGGVPTVRCSDVKPRAINLANIRKVSEEIEGDYRRTRLVGGEILLNIRGTLGGVALVPPDLNGYNVAREVAVVPIFRKLSGEYLVNVMASPYFWQAILDGLRGIAYKGLNLNSLRLFEIPLPPLAEQRRIVVKVDELMAVCDRLESQLTTAQTESRRLLEAVLHEALGPAIEQN